MSWAELWLRGDSQDSELFEQALLDSGALSITVTDAADQPILEPAPGETPLWSQIIVTALYEGQSNLEHRAKAVLQATGEKALDWGQRRFDDEDWSRRWLIDFKPMRFGETLWVCAHHHEPPADAVVLRLDPGLAFGTGTHPTTAMCLHWLAANPPTAQRVVDYGCGSGILGIAAALLGAQGVVATDIDPQALQATTENARANAVADLIEATEPEQVDGTFDLILANILSGPLIELAPKLSQLVRSGGHIVVTGILDDQSEAVQAAYRQCGAQLAASEQLEQWNLHVLTMP